MSESLAEHLRALDAEVAGLKEAGLDGLTDKLAGLLSAHYAGAASRAAEEAGRAGLSLETLHSLATNIVALRKGDQSAARLQLEREWIEIERQRARERSEAYCVAWARDPANQNKIRPSTLSEEERARRIREIFKMPEPPKAGLSPEGLAEIERAAKLL